MRKLSDEARERKLAYDTKYMTSRIRQKTISFNIGMKEDMELYDWVNKQPNQAKYMKGLIRDDMDKRK